MAFGGAFERGASMAVKENDEGDEVAGEVLDGKTNCGDKSVLLGPCQSRLDSSLLPNRFGANAEGVAGEEVGVTAGLN